jgi:hypothetical protein
MGALSNSATAPSMDSRRLAIGESSPVNLSDSLINSTATPEYATGTGGKPWRYALIPHDVINGNVTIRGLVERYG